MPRPTVLTVDRAPPCDFHSVTTLDVLPCRPARAPGSLDPSRFLATGLAGHCLPNDTGDIWSSHPCPICSTVHGAGICKPRRPVQLDVSHCPRQDFYPSVPSLKAAGHRTRTTGRDHSMNEYTIIASVTLYLVMARSVPVSRDIRPRK